MPYRTLSSRRVIHPIWNPSSSSASIGVPYTVANALSVFDYLSDLFPARLSNKLSAHRRLVKLLRCIVILASVSVAINKCVVDLGQLALGSCSVGMMIRSFDDLAPALERWIADNVVLKTSPSVWKASSAAHLKRFSPRSAKRKARGEASEHEIVAVEISSYWFVWKGNLFKYEIDKNAMESVFHKSRTIRRIGFSKKPILDLLQEAHQYYTEKYATHMTRIWSVREGDWQPLADRKARRLDTVDLHEDDKRNLIEDIQHYLSEEGEDNCHNRGSPYRRGYLFHGPPGTGKSSLSMAIAAHFKMEVSIISLKSSGLNDSELLRTMASVPPYSMLLLEDIDSAGIDRETVDESDKTSSEESVADSAGGRRFGKKPSVPARVTLSGLLNALDGAAAPEGCVLIMTTNNPDALDPALTRPGRVDYKIEFKNADKQLARKIFCRVTRNLSDEDLEKFADEFASQIPDQVLSPAELHGFLLTRGDDIPKALEELPQWIEETLTERAHSQKQEEEDKKKAEERAKKAKKAADEEGKGKDAYGPSEADAEADVVRIEYARKTSELDKTNGSHRSSPSSSSISIIELSEVQPLTQQTGTSV